MPDASMRLRKEMRRPDTMIIRIEDDFDPDKIADSGQCFRWTKRKADAPAAYRIIAGTRRRINS